MREIPKIVYLVSQLALQKHPGLIVEWRKVRKPNFPSTLPDKMIITFYRFNMFFLKALHMSSTKIVFQDNKITKPKRNTQHLSKQTFIHSAAILKEN